MISVHGNMEDLQGLVGEWGNETFGAGHAESCLCHFFEEVVELAQATGLLDVLLGAMIDRKYKDDTASPAKAPEEAADCMLLLLQFAYREGFSLYDAVMAKHTINQERKWGEPDENGVVKHIKEGKA